MRLGRANFSDEVCSSVSALGQTKLKEGLSNEIDETVFLFNSLCTIISLNLYFHG